MRSLIKNSKRIIVKVGTSLLTKRDGTLNSDYIENISKQLIDLRKNKKEVILVTSGAMGAGIKELGFKGKLRDTKLRQIASAVGQAILMSEYKKSFGGQKIAQLLLTYDSFMNRKTYLNLKNSLSELLKMRIIPIINENDPISTEEIGNSFGDNDQLSALVASKIEADLLVMLTIVDGLYDNNRKTVKVVNEITEEIERYAGKAKHFGTGGMKSKLKSAKIATEAGVTTIIANGNVQEVLKKIINGEDIGTIFYPKEKISNKKRWISYSKPKGSIIVDEGAKNAMLKGKNLLPAGILSVEGDFMVGEVVNISFNNKVFAKAIIDFSSDDLEKIKGKNSSEVEKILCEDCYANVTRGENLVVLE